MGRISIGAKVWLLENLPKKKCRYCHSKENLTYDHKTPMIKGGKTEKKNIQVLCRECNQMKSNMTNGQVKQLLKWAEKIINKKMNKSQLALELLKACIPSSNPDNYVELEEILLHMFPEIKEEYELYVKNLNGNA